MTERFVFRHDPTVPQVLGRLTETPRGRDFLGRTFSEFSTLAAVLQNTDEYQGSTFVHEPDGLNVELINVSKQEFTRAATIVAERNGWSTT